MIMINDSTPLVSAEIIRKETVEIRWEKLYRLINKAKKKGKFQCYTKEMGALTDEEISKLELLGYIIYLNNFGIDYVIDWSEDKNEESK